MTDLDFWKLIESIDVSALENGMEDEAIEPLRAALGTKSEQELFAFEELLSRQLHALDGKAFADQAGDCGDSDDAFLYARCYVVARGRAFHEAVISDPTHMPKSVEQWCESLLYPHREAWADLTCKDQSEWPFEASVSYETGNNEDLWQS